MLEGNTTAPQSTFFDLLSNWQNANSVGSEDLLAATLPLLQQVATLHQNGLVAPLNGIDHLRLAMGHLWFANADAHEPQSNPRALQSIATISDQAIEVTGQYRERQDQDGSTHISNGELAEHAEETTQCAWYPGYIAWEQRLDHHDPLTDIFVLGLLIGSLATRLDLSKPEALETFLAARNDIHHYNPRIHPVIAQIIKKMTALERRKRPQDLEQITSALAHYREQEAESADHNERITAGDSNQNSTRHHIQKRLRNRLFEINRRNRLIYFKETGGSANLTIGSVPHVLDHTVIRTNQLFYLNSTTAKQLDRQLELGRWLRFEDYPYLAASLDKIRLQARRDEREYGFSQLHVVIAFLRWTNLKEAPEERINSPLLLIPATLTKQKGVKDRLTLLARASEAEINPALRHHLRALYNIQLPETIDASNFDEVVALHAHLTKQLAASAKGITLTLVEKPRIKLIHRTAKRKLADFRRRRRTGTRVKDYRGISYSYAQTAFEPLGIQIFERDIRIAQAPSRDLAEEHEKPPAPAEKPNTEPSDPTESATIEGQFYAIDEGAEAGAYQWEIDLCSVTLSNFNYRKMTLVRDYATLLETEEQAHSNFDLLFSEEARQPERKPNTSNADNYLVLPADPSQIEAIERAKQGESYVIQGPPGTGKSQTIANLIADYVARGKTVLFVCEKRAALDVVFHRLQQVGLGDGCSLIHDSQSDKKAFIEELKEIYERWLNEQPDGQYAQQRSAIQKKLKRPLQQLQQFSSAMTKAAEKNGPSVRTLLETRIHHPPQAITLPAQAVAHLPSWSAFQKAADSRQQIQDTLITSGADGILGHSPMRLLRGELATTDNAIERIERILPRLTASLTEATATSTRAAHFIDQEKLSFSELIDLSQQCRNLHPLASAQKLAALDADSPASQRLYQAIERFTQQQQATEDAEAQAQGWSETVPMEILDNALATARLREGSFLAIFFADWWAAKRLVKQYHRGFTTTIAATLEKLAQRRNTRLQLAAERAEIEQTFALTPNPETLQLLTEMRSESTSSNDMTRALRKACISAPETAAREVLGLGREAGSLKATEDELKEFFKAYESLSNVEIAHALEALSNNLDLIPEFSALLAELDQADGKLSTTLRHLPLAQAEIELAVLDHTLDRTLQRNRNLRRFDSKQLETLANELKQHFAKLRALHGHYALAQCRTQFHEDISRSNEASAGASRNEKEWRRDFRRGRKILENEFRKSRAFKSIRELFAGDAEEPLRRLKPVWLMSPLSVADILPLSEQLFDVVIFDEASQIPLEDAIPSLYRAQQMIIVGDEMQLPPSAFFASQASEEEDEESYPGVFVYDLNADSFLNRATVSLPRTMLSWHYRSQHESLIGYCNRAFYGGELQTIPSTKALSKQPAITVSGPKDAHENATQALARPLSFHKMADSPYAAQVNLGEAQYIAQLVCEILRKENGLSIGVVAFSQAQQRQIEQSIEDLAASDEDFRRWLDLEEEREEDGQFVGLFVKNLENVQGDERDIIILSICYGPDARGKMRMNFGPINQNGGEKRLNVIFSRAKKHMMVVSSLDSQQITNTHNFGANALRQYLSYARAASLGDFAAMMAALSEYASADSQTTTASQQHLADQLATALQQHGLETHRNYGQSELKCHIAVRQAGDPNYRLAILIDDHAHYANPDIIARYVTRPAILSAFGWEVYTVLAKDWRDNQEQVVNSVLARLETVMG